MDKKLSKEELIELVKKLRETNITDEQADILYKTIRQTVIDPNVWNLVFFTELSPEEVIEKALEYKPIIL